MATVYGTKQRAFGVESDRQSSFNKSNMMLLSLFGRESLVLRGRFTTEDDDDDDDDDEEEDDEADDFLFFPATDTTCLVEVVVFTGAVFFELLLLALWFNSVVCFFTFLLALLALLLLDVVFGTVLFQPRILYCLFSSSARGCFPAACNDATSFCTSFRSVGAASTSRS